VLTCNPWVSVEGAAGVGGAAAAAAGHEGGGRPQCSCHHDSSWGLAWQLR